MTDTKDKAMPTDAMIEAFVKASDSNDFGVEKGSFLWETTERGLIAALALTTPPAPQAGEIERVVRNAFNEGFAQGLRENVSDRGGYGFDASKAKNALAALRSAQAPAETLVCGACGEPWHYGLTCGQKDNGHAFPTCYPAPTVFKQQAPARTYADGIEDAAKVVQDFPAGNQYVPPTRKHLAEAIHALATKPAGKEP